MKTKYIVLLSTIAAISLILFIYFLASISHVEKHEFGFSYNKFTGEVESLQRAGWHFRPAIKYSVHTIDERPYQIRVSANMSIGERILNAKLVRFNRNGIDQFISWHGRDAGDNINNLKEVFLCYAFATDGGASCPFITIEKSSVIIEDN